MQCIPLPKNPSHTSYEIPLFSDEGYDGQGIATYPDRQGWTLRAVEDWVRIFDDPPPQFVAFLERWLFFSYPHAVMSADASHFIEWTGNPRYPVLTTRLLPSLLEQYRNHPDWTYSQAGAADIEQGMRMHILLVAAPNITRIGFDMSETKTLLEFIESCATVDPRRPSMVMATSFLFEATLAAISGDAHMGPILSHEVNITFLLNWDSLLWKLLHNNAWRPSELAPIFSRTNSSSAWFLYHLSRPASPREHPLIRVKGRDERKQESKVYGLCTAVSCSYKRLNDATYERQHTSSCQGCYDVVANPVSLCSILRRRKIPLIAPIDEDTQHDEIPLLAAEPGCTYIAISHVWSDGLGNPQRNAIPRCQLLRLSRIVRSHHPTSSFWLDTLCVPPDTANLQLEQGIALELIRKTYEDAEGVIVLDSWVAESSFKDKSDVENLHKIFYCAWNTRLWTFQEGALARTLLFQFKDGLYDVDKGIVRLKSNKDPAVDFTVKPILVRMHNQIRGFRSAGSAISDKLKFISESTAARATSVSADETLCLAALLELDVDRIIKTDPQMRMQEFWRMLPSIPVGFLFGSHHKRMDLDGFRWAPRSLLGINEIVDVKGSALLTLRETGLWGAGSGLRLGTRDASITGMIRLCDEKKNWYMLNLHVEDCPEAKEITIDGDNPITRKAINVREAYDCDEIGIIFNESLKADDQTDMEGIISKPSGQTIVLLAIKEVVEGCIYGRYICSGLCQELKSGYYDNDAKLLQQLFEENKEYLKPEEIESLDLRPDNIALSFEGGDLDIKDIKELLRSGILTAGTGGNLAFEEDSKILVAGRSFITKTDQRWCIF